MGVIGTGSVGSTLGRRLLASNRFIVKYGEWKNDSGVRGPAYALEIARLVWYLRQLQHLVSV